MNAIELYHADGKSAGVFYCAECRCVKPSVEQADVCCAPPSCSTPACNKLASNGWAYCNPCCRARSEAREQARFDKATKVSVVDYQGSFVCVSDRYFRDIGELHEWLVEEHQEFVDCGGASTEWPLPHVYGTKPTQPMIDSDGAVESALEESHEDAYDEVSAEALAELDAFTSAWSKVHLPVSYAEDNKTALVYDLAWVTGCPCT